MGPILPKFVFLSPDLPSFRPSFHSSIIGADQSCDHGLEDSQYEAMTMAMN